MRMRLLIVLPMTVALLAGCEKPETAVVTIKYEIQPDRGLPPGMHGLAVDQVTAESGSGNEAIDEAKWQEMVGEMMHNRLNEAKNERGLDIVIADRASTKSVMAEKDLAMSGMAEGAEVAERTQLVGVDGLIRGRVIIKVDAHSGSERTVEGGNVLSYATRGWIGGGSSSSEKSSIARTITVQPSFRLLDANTGQDWYTWTPAEPIIVTEGDKPGFFFGSGKTEADLTPRDRIIAGCVQNAIVEFTSHLIPTTFAVEVPVISSTNKSCIQGVKYLRADDTETALQMFKQALADNPEDARAAFCAGVASEKLGQYEAAIKYYNQALMSQNDSQYKDSRDRVKQFKDHVGKS